MNTDVLVELIAKRVMEQLLALQGQSVINKPLQSVLVVGDCDNRQQLEQTLGNNYSLSFTADRQNDGCPQPARLELAKYDHIILASLSNSLLSALAIGLERGSEGCVIVESLLLGKTVHILEEGIVYRRFRDTANPAFYQVFQNKEATLCSFGMAVVTLDSLSDALTGVDTPEKPENASINEVVYQVSAPKERSYIEPKLADKGVFNLEQRVVGEKDLRACYEQGYRKIRLQERALITPLAKDFLRMKDGLELV
ncbi:hypothetical protein [Endozoicomonas elysicola]|uniref:Uncharacterized protein n=1 Tax=Endozoicomonas elysicola TaxID=305900 RepID=A0A081K5L2_9GAMM|nr:hypothetical protein [Endozoicomonas elysicola]KEI69438.1 hypothetical protein GV64_00645 [Endozoicomonas elysicola]